MIPNMDMQEFEILTPMEVVEVKINRAVTLQLFTSLSEKILNFIIYFPRRNTNGARKTCAIIRSYVSRCS
jgi:hypothetical protein